MSYTTVPNVGMVIPLSPEQEEPQQVQMHYVPPVDVLTGPRIADALEQIANSLEEISAKLGAHSVASPPQPTVHRDQYVIYVTSQTVQDDLCLTGCYLYRGSNRINEWFPVHKRDLVHDMLLTIFTAVKSLGVAARTDSPIVVVSNVLDAVQLLNSRGPKHTALIEDIHHIAESLQTKIETHTTTGEPTIEELIRETTKIKERVCSQLQATESSTQT